jgi:outer membrane protein OmpA-like peptidoglycan-associated protein
MHFAQHFTRSGLALILAGFVSACGGAKDAAVPSEAQAAPLPSLANAECVQLVPGSYYWDGSRFVGTPVAAGSEDGLATPQALSGISDDFIERGLPWLNYALSGRVATLSGNAPDLRARDRALESGGQILSERTGRNDLIIADAIRIGDAPGPGAHLGLLAQSGVSIRSCQDVFNRTMNGRTIQFASDEARISPASATLLDALSGAAELCRPYQIEIGGHTDFMGSDDHNLDLSQKRADAVRQYLIDRGIDARRLTARGYGESQPLDPGETQAARAKNRRTEFKVVERR